MLLLKSLMYLIRASSLLPGRLFDRYGRMLGLRILIAERKLHRLLLNPVSSVRYFEFDYVLKNMPELGVEAQILDISSPYLFGFYLIEKYPARYMYVNPDVREAKEIGFVIDKVKRKGVHKFESQDARNLSYSDETFDVVVCISVIEHIDGDGDTQAMREMWRVLKPGGVMILTFPVKPEFEEEYRKENVYNLDVGKKGGSYFFQRYYDQDAVENRLYAALSEYRITSRAFYAEICPGFFSEYEKRWLKKGLAETVKDPYLMDKNMKELGDFESLSGMGVAGITIEKSL
ncbi:MAG: class I SAM-dependent methyltransferase [Gammaproteobacteria bacterium]|nr:class I SAM-dependent methyltransferase [Gammaproteobacteria bacterium]